VEFFLPAVLWVVLNAAQAAPQDPSAVSTASIERIKTRLSSPSGPSLAPSEPVAFMPIFRSRVDQRVFVPTLEEDLHKTFDLNAYQRQSAAWASQCCGLDLGAVFNRVDKALAERRARKAREEVARALAELKATSRRRP
jgi:hypothetical protein